MAEAPEGQVHTVPPHVIARTEALDDAYDALRIANGRVPAHANYATDYLHAVHRECTRELYGMLDSLTVPRGETWLLVTASEEGGDTVTFESKEARQKADNTLVLLIEHGDARVGLLAHDRRGGDNTLRVRLPGTQHHGVALEDVLGPRHAVVERIDAAHRRGFAPPGRSVVQVGYVGDLVASMTATRMQAARADERANGALEDGPRGFHEGLLTALSTGRRRHTEWPLVPRDRVPHLNETQYRAIDTLAHNVELVRGPPGAGKSTLIDAMVRECVAGTDAVCVTAVQNRAVEVRHFHSNSNHTTLTCRPTCTYTRLSTNQHTAQRLANRVIEICHAPTSHAQALVKKFVATKTPFIAHGSRASPATAEWTLQSQVDRDEATVAAQKIADALGQLRQRVKSAIALRMAKIYRPLVETESSDRQRVRELRARRLTAHPSDELRASAKYAQWAEAHPTAQAKASNAGKRALDDVVADFMRFHLDPWRKAADAIVLARMPEAHAFFERLGTELDRATHAVDKAREAAELRVATDARAFVCTTATVGTAMRTQRAQLGPLLSRLRTLVCDEAGTLADRHIVPVIAAADVERLVMVGDPAQLSCFTTVRHSTPISAMQRLLTVGMPSMLLTDQYRMPPTLCDLVSQCFYDGELTTAETRAQGRADVAAPVRLLSVPKGRAEPLGGGSSLVNRAEVEVVVREAARLRGRYGADAEIVVLTTYGAQRRAIEQALDDEAPVLTVDSAQGQEWDHVIYSHVASDRHRLGFTTNRNRLCVAFSRAKRSLVAVAHPVAVTAIADLKALKVAAFEDSDAMRRVVVAALRGEQGRVTTANAFRVCCICQDPISRTVGFLECDPPLGNATAHTMVHAMCPECADGHVNAALEREGFDGELRCPCRPEAAGGCMAAAYTAADVAKIVSNETFERWNRTVVAKLERDVAQRLEADMNERLDARVAALAIDDDARDRERDEARVVAHVVEHVLERILTLRCPACDAAFIDYDACAALTCHCGTQFCGFCLQRGRGGNLHEHVANCHENPLRRTGDAGVFVTERQFERAQHERKTRLVREYLDDHPHRAAVLRALAPHGIELE